MALPVYLRTEPTTDAETLRMWPGTRKRDVVAYADPECSQRKARWPWFYKSKPDRRHKRVTLNCYQWEAVWLPDAT